MAARKVYPWLLPEVAWGNSHWTSNCPCLEDPEHGIVSCGAISVP